MTAVVLASLVLVGVASAAVALERHPIHQVIALGFQGMALSLLFVAFQAPEVALSQLAVGAVLVPLMFLAALARTTRRRQRT